MSHRRKFLPPARELRDLHKDQGYKLGLEFRLAVGEASGEGLLLAVGNSVGDGVKVAVTKPGEGEVKTATV